MSRTFSIPALAALLLCAAGCVSSTNLALEPAPELIRSKTPKGYLLIVGGGGTTTDMYTKAIGLGGGNAAAKVVVFPQASELADTGESSAAVWRDMGVEAQNVAVADTKDPARALELVESATIIWFPGGVQKRLMDALGDKLPAAIVKRYEDGALVGGTSAGAAVMSKDMITGEYMSETGEEGGLCIVQANTVKTDQGLGLIDWAIVDQHFFRRRRFNRLLSCVLDKPKLVGIGIDERTSILVHGTGFDVIGESNVLVIDARHARDLQPKEGLRSTATGLRMSLLAHGMHYDVTD